MWLHVPDLASVQDTAGLTSASALPWANDTKLSVTLSGKHSQRPVSWRGWKTRLWIMRLSGIMCEPSTVTRGAERWMSSLGDTRASHSPAQVADLVSATRATSGPIFDVLCQRYSQQHVFSRTSAHTSQMDLIPFEATFETSATAWKTTVESLRLDCLQRRKWAHRINGNGCSFWGTPRVTSGDYCYARGDHSRQVLTLEGQCAKLGRLDLRESMTFREWLMGIPQGWTDAGCSATESHQQWQQKHGAVYLLGLWQEVERLDIQRSTEQEA